VLQAARCKQCELLLRCWEDDFGSHAMKKSLPQAAPWLHIYRGDTCCLPDLDVASTEPGRRKGARSTTISAEKQTNQLPTKVIKYTGSIVDPASGHNSQTQKERDRGPKIPPARVLCSHPPPKLKAKHNKTGQSQTKSHTTDNRPGKLNPRGSNYRKQHTQGCTD
jgi:hypothetical protein